MSVEKKYDSPPLFYSDTLMETPAIPPLPLSLEALETQCKAIALQPNAPQAIVQASPDFYDKVFKYLTILMQWNARMNLVGATTWQQALENLLADSWYLADFLTTLPLPEAPECWDLGAGAGLPGIPLRMVWEKGTYTLVEAREKRALFLQSVLAVCPLPRVRVFRGRAEKFMPSVPPANMVVSRAFLPWQTVLELIEPYLAPQGLAIFLTLTPPPEELPLAWHCIKALHYQSGTDTRYFWALQHNTP